MLRVKLRSQDGAVAGPTSYETAATRERTAVPAEAPVDFADWVSLRLPALLRFAHALTGNPHDASDLVQEVLERVGVRWSSVGRGPGGPDAYVRRAMVNARTSRWRRRRPETLVDAVPETAVAARDRFDDEPLWLALKDLPQRQRAVIVLRYYEDLSEAEIAATLGISPGTVKSQSARAMAGLRRRLDSENSSSLGGELR